MATHHKEYRLLKTGPEESRNKQQQLQQVATNPGE